MKQHQFTQLLNQLIKTGETKLTKNVGYGRDVFVIDRTAFTAWKIEVELVCAQLGPKWAHHAQQIQRMSASDESKDVALGVLHGIRRAIHNGLLKELFQIARAETLDDLLSQGNHLREMGYALAAAVLGRAVLEAQLRAAVTKLGVVITSTKPTIQNFVDALYKEGKISLDRKRVLERLAGIGNNAAHNKPEFDPSLVKVLLDEVAQLNASGIVK